RSKAFIFDSERFPEMRRNTTRVTYASTPMIKVRNRLCVPLKNSCSKRPPRLDVKAERTRKRGTGRYHDHQDDVLYDASISLLPLNIVQMVAPDHSGCTDSRRNRGRRNRGQMNIYKIQTL